MPDNPLIATETEDAKIAQTTQSRTPYLQKWDLNNSEAINAMRRRIVNLKPGETIEYFRGPTGNIDCGRFHNNDKPSTPLFELLARLRDAEAAIFTQKNRTNDPGRQNIFSYYITGRDPRKAKS